MSGRGPSARVRELNLELEQRVAERTADLEAANDRLRTALAEKEVLLREVHHRVKNNLQVVSSLMSLQARKAPAALKPYFQESLERVGAIGRVHEQLYRTEGSGTFDAAVLLRTICGDIAQIYGDRSGPDHLPGRGRPGGTAAARRRNAAGPDRQRGRLQRFQARVRRRTPWRNRRDR